MNMELHKEGNILPPSKRIKTEILETNEEIVTGFEAASDLTKSAERDSFFDWQSINVKIEVKNEIIEEISNVLPLVESEEVEPDEINDYQNVMVEVTQPEDIDFEGISDSQINSKPAETLSISEILPDQRKHHYNTNNKKQGSTFRLYKCVDCSEAFAQIEDTVIHINETHSGYHMYKCNFCHITCSKLTQLVLHCNDCTKAPNPYMCNAKDNCKKRNFTSPTELTDHLKQLIRNEYKNGNFDNTNFWQTNDFKTKNLDDNCDSLLTVTQLNVCQKPEQSDLTSPIKLPLICSVCLKPFLYEAYKCRICKPKKVFSSYATLSSHYYNSHHYKRDKNEAYLQPFSCNVFNCKEKFSDSKLLSQHFFKVHLYNGSDTSRLHENGLCDGYRTSWPDAGGLLDVNSALALDRNVRIHFNATSHYNVRTRKFKCSACGLNVKSKQDFKYHLQVIYNPQSSPNTNPNSPDIIKLPDLNNKSADTIRVLSQETVVSEIEIIGKGSNSEVGQSDEIKKTQCLSLCCFCNMPFECVEDFRRHFFTYH